MSLSLRHWLLKVMRLVKREVNIQEHSDTISINGVEIHADQIREIKVSGCHKAAFQISLKNRA